MRHLRWLTLLGVLGVLGWVTVYKGLQAMFGFLVFLPLFGYDERKDAIFKQAATIAFVATTITLTGTLVYAGLVLVPKPNVVNLVSTLGYALAVTYIIHVLTCVLSYVYFELRGFRQ